MKKRLTLFYVLAVLLLLFVLYLVFFPMPGSTPDTVPVLLPSAEATAKEEKPDVSPQLIEVDPDSVQTVIRTMSRADSYSRSICSESFWSGGETRRNIDVWCSGNNSKIEVSRPDTGDKMHILITGDEKQIWYSDRYGRYKGAADSAEADRYQSLLSYERILDIDKSAITEAGYQEYLGEMCVYVRYTGGGLGYDNICYVSLATGLVMGEESYEDGVLAVRVTSTVPSLVEIDDSVFRAP